MHIGYARVSTGDQTLALQLDALRAAGCEKIYEEQASGIMITRVELTNCLKALREGDTLVIWKLDRLGRNTKDLIAIAEDLRQRRIALKTLTGFEFDTNTAHGTLLLHVFAALAEYERTLIQERIKAGLIAARARGRVGGRKPKLSRTQQDQARALEKGGWAVTKIAKTLGCSRHTVYKAIKTGEQAGKAPAE